MDLGLLAQLPSRPEPMATVAARVGVPLATAERWVRALLAQGAPLWLEQDLVWRADRVEHLKNHGLGVEVRWFEVVPSTQDVLASWAAVGAPHGAVVVARQQTAGRGRQGRSWVSPPGSGVYLSVLLRDLPVARAGLLPLAAGLAVVDATGIGQLKWPNDVLAPDGRKLAGVLAEASGAEPRRLDLRLGVGLNLRRSGLPPEAAALEEWVRHRRPEDWVRAFLACLERWLARLATPERLLDAWRTRAVWLGETVEVRQGTRCLRGVFLDVDPSGALLLRGDDGALHRCVAGEVQLRRAA